MEKGKGPNLEYPICILKKYNDLEITASKAR